MGILLGRWQSAWRKSFAAILEECYELYCTKSVINMPQNSSCMATYLLSLKQFDSSKTFRTRNQQHEPGVNSKCKTRSYVTLCIPVSIYWLTLAWISSENSTTHEECWLILTRLPSLLWTSSHIIRLVSLLSSVDCPVRRTSPTPSQSLCLTLFSRSLTHFRSRRDLESKTLCLVSRQNRQRNILLGGPPT